MQLDFQLRVIGCGDAYDGSRTNASLLVQQQTFSLLIDCGPTVPSQLFNLIQPDDLDAIYITHSHPDHCLGLTSLLNWMGAHQRRHPLTLIAQRAQWAVLEPLITFAHWPHSQLGFDVIWQESELTQQIGPWSAITTPTQHAVDNLSLQLTTPAGHRLFYSGDGQLCQSGEILAQQSDWVFIECETIQYHKSHGSWQSIQLLQPKLNSKWYLYHIDPACRAQLAKEITGHLLVNLAEDGMQLTLETQGVSHVAKTI